MPKYLDENGLAKQIAIEKQTFIMRSEAQQANAVPVDSAPTSGSTNLVTSGGVYSGINPTKGTSIPSGGFLPNKEYNLGTITGSKTFSLASSTDNNISNFYFWTFSTSSTAPTITWPSNITWQGGSAPTIAANKYYEILIHNSKATALVF